MNRKQTIAAILSSLGIISIGFFVFLAEFDFIRTFRKLSEERYPSSWRVCRETYLDTKVGTFDPIRANSFSSEYESDDWPGELLDTLEELELWYEKLYEDGKLVIVQFTDTPLGISEQLKLMEEPRAERVNFQKIYSAVKERNFGGYITIITDDIGLSIGVCD